MERSGRTRTGAGRGTGRGPDRDRGRGPAGSRDRGKMAGRRGGRRQKPAYALRKKVCRFCGEKKTSIDYKETPRLQKYLTEKGKIIPSRISGNCAKHQRQLARAIKRARAIAILPYVAE